MEPISHGVLCTIEGRCYTCGAKSGEYHPEGQRCTLALRNGHLDAARALVYGPTLEGPALAERTMTWQEWQRLCDLADANANALATTDPRSEGVMRALAAKCRVRAIAAKEGRCMP